MLHFVEGEKDKPSEGWSLAVPEVEGFRLLPMPQVEVSAHIDANGVLHDNPQTSTDTWHQRDNADPRQ